MGSTVATVVVQGDPGRPARAVLAETQAGRATRASHPGA
jgi:hypothetical protein